MRGIFLGQAADALAHGLRTGGGRRQQRFFQNGAEQHLGAGAPILVDIQIEVRQCGKGAFFDGAGFGTKAENLPFREFLPNFIAHIFFEAAHK